MTEALKLYDEMELRLMLVSACRTAGGEAGFALARGLTEDEVRTVITNGQPSAKLCKALGFMPVTRYIRQ